MIKKIIVNNEYEFPLCSWSASSFSADPVFRLATDDLRGVKNAFTVINKIDLYFGNEQMGEFFIYDTYSDISFMGTIYSDDFNSFVDCMEIRLQKSNLAEQVQRLDDIVNNIVDEDSMSINELRDRRLNQISAAGQRKIFEGTLVLLSDGTTKHFKYNLEDQNDISQYMMLIPQFPGDLTNLRLPYHSSGEICQLYPAIDIVIVYFELQSYLLYWQTYTNMLRMYVNTLQDIEEIRSAQFGMSLPQSYQEQMNELLQDAMAAMNILKEQYGIITPPDEDVDPEVPDTEEPEVNDENGE